MSITSDVGSQTSSSSASVQVLASDDHEIVSASVTLNGGTSGISGGLAWIVNPLSRGGTLVLTLQSGVNTIVATACDDSGVHACATDTLQITYNAPPPPPSRQAPSLALATHDRWHSAGLYSATLSYSTPAYVSMDQARGVTLVYASNQAKPVGYVEVDATDISSDPIEHMSITVRDANAVVVASERFYVAGSGVNRLAAQWDVSTLATGAYLYTVEVRSYWATGSALSSTIQTRVIVLNDAQPFGKGWSLAGLRRVVSVGDDRLVIHGDGTASYFVWTGSAFERPDGETGELARVTTADTLLLSYPDGSSARFAFGRQTSTRDRFGNTTTFAYDGSGRLTTVTDPAGKQITLAYAGSFLSSITTPKGTSTFTFNSTAQTLTEVENPNVAFTATYLSDGRLSYWLDATGERWDVSYDDFLRVDTLLTPTVVAGGSSVRLATGVRSIPAVTLPASGAGTSRTNAVARRQPGSLRMTTTDPRGIVTEMAVDRYGLPTYVKEPLGVWTSISRDTNGNPRQVSNHLNESQSYEWTPRGQLLRSTNLATGQQTTVTYDTITTTGGTAAILPVAINANGFVQETELGTNGVPLRILLAGDTLQTMTYASDGRVLTATDAEGYQTTYHYATTGTMNTDSVRAVTSLGVQTQRFVYDAAGHVIESTNPLGETSSRLIDDLNRTYEQADALGRITQTEYALPDVVVTDAAGKTYTRSANAVGWTVAEVDPESRSRTFTYDRGGNVTSVTDRRGRTVTFAYDSLSRVISRTADSVTTTYAYDNPAGRWIAASNPESTDTIYFDDAGRDTLTIRRMNGARFALRAQYHPNGPRTSLELLSPFQRSVRYVYNPNTLRLESLIGMGGDTTWIRHNTLGQVTRHTFPGSNGYRQYFYNDRNLPSLVSYTGTTASNSLYRAYTYDELDRVSRIDYAPNDTATTFAYDSVGQVSLRRSYEYDLLLQCVDPMDDTTCSYVQVPSIRNEQTFTYDSVGNRTDSGAALEPTSNRYSTFDGYTLAYDDEGNLVSKTKTGFTQTFTWNALGQLASVTTNGTTVTYGYDGWGVRVRRTEGSTVSRYLYDGDDLLVELDGSNNPVREYTYRPGIDRPHSVRTGGVTYYYAQDALGNVVGAFNASGLAMSQGFTAFGVFTDASGTLTQPLGFKARERDPVTGLYYMRNRWYDAEQGRFVSEDPIGLAGGINVYAFGGNDPVNLSDPMGLSPGCIFMGLMKVEFPGGVTRYYPEFYCPAANAEDHAEESRRRTWGNRRAPTATASIDGEALESTLERWAPCLLSTASFGLSLASDATILTGGGLALKGASLWLQGSRTWARSATMNAGRGAARRQGMGMRNAGRGMVYAGTSQATAAYTGENVWLAGPHATLIQDGNSDEPSGWAFVPFVGTYFGLIQVIKDCRQAVAG